MKKPSPKILREYFSYDPGSGELRWIKLDFHNRRAKLGALAGCAAYKEDGRVIVGFKGCLIKAHILIWAYQTGKWPTHRIDHRNRDPSDNRWCNLRRASQSQNMSNVTRLQKNNKSGYRGVHWVTRVGRWCAKIKANGITYTLGHFSTKKDASEVYKKASKRLHKMFSPYH